MERKLAVIFHADVKGYSRLIDLFASARRWARAGKLPVAPHFVSTVGKTHSW
jgi:hypothetical protein